MNYKFLDLNGLGSLIDKLKTIFASSTHEHSASNITSGTLPISRGGTGGDTASTARDNIDAINILVQDTQPTSQNVGDFWFQKI